MSTKEKTIREVQAENAITRMDEPDQKLTHPAGMSTLDDAESGSDEDKSESDVTSEEKEMLAKLDRLREDGEDEVLEEAGLDTTDADGTPLNEKSFTNDLAGRDLDVPGSEEDDADEDIGEEDEENNEYSLDDQED